MFSRSLISVKRIRNAKRCFTRVPELPEEKNQKSIKELTSKLSILEEKFELFEHMPIVVEALVQNQRKLEIEIMQDVREGFQRLEHNESLEFYRKTIAEITATDEKIDDWNERLKKCETLESSVNIKVAKIDEDGVVGKIPEAKRDGDAGMDIYAATDGIIPKGGQFHKVRTGLIFGWPMGKYYIRIAPRSGLTVNENIHVGAGVIDVNSRGEVMVVLQNHGNEDFEYKQHDRIAQMILEKSIPPPAIKFKYCDPHEIDETERGVLGFGSTDEKEASVGRTVENLDKSKIKEVKEISVTINEN